MAAQNPVHSHAEDQKARGEDAPVCLSPFEVRTESSVVAAFSRETGGQETGDFVPLTFPFCWLTLPKVRAEILDMIGGDSFVPVHESQSFAYERELHVDTDYLLAFELSQVAKPPRVIVRLTILTLADEVCARLETVLRIVALTSKAAP